MVVFLFSLCEGYTKAFTESALATGDVAVFWKEEYKERNQDEQNYRGDNDSFLDLHISNSSTVRIPCHFPAVLSIVIAW